METFLKRIELQGFKSFAAKTVLDFPARVTAVVGPNGSGKSNIIDAFRWVLGEREAKQLRGETLDTLIFAGTPKRPAVSLAKVSLHFDNRSRIFPLATEEVALERKVDRSGVSQYFLHDSEVRLRDLVPMLARARMGSRGLMMVGQGQSDLFVRSSPQERRAMVEEILGLREYRLKKAQSERQLASSEGNLEKVKAMLDELAPHLRFLRRQKGRFERRTEIETTLRDLENRTYVYRERALKAELQKLSEPSGEVTGKIHVLEDEIAKLEKELDRTYRSPDDGAGTRKIRAELSEALVRRGEAEKALARIEARIELGLTPETTERHSIAEMESLLRDLAREVAGLLTSEDLVHVKRELEGWQKKLARFESKPRSNSVEGLEKEREELRKALAAVDNGIRELQKKEENVAAEQQKLNQAFRSDVERLEAKKNELRALHDQIRTFAFEREKVELRLQEVKREWQSIGRSLSELEELPAPTEPPDEDSERRMLRLRGEMAAIGEIDENLVKEARESEERYEFLHREFEDLTKAAADLRTLIRDLEVRIHGEFKSAFRAVNEEFNKYFRLMFSGGRAHLKLTKYEPPAPVEVTAEAGEETTPAPTEPEEKRDPELDAGVEVELSLPKKKITSLEMLSGGEKSLVSLAALFALISVSPPPFLVLDEIDAALDEENARRFAELIKEFSGKSQFIIVTHNRSTMEAADILYGVTMGDDGVSKVLSLKLEA